MAKKYKTKPRTEKVYVKPRELTERNRHNMSWNERINAIKNISKEDRQEMYIKTSMTGGVQGTIRN